MKRFTERFVIVVGHQKGGIGKTTVAVLLLKAALEQGYQAVLLDADPQSIASDWRDIAVQRGLPAPPVQSVTLNELRPTLDKVAPGTLVIVDVPPAIGEILTDALKLADLLLIPCAPEPACRLALRKTLKLVQSVRSQKPRLQGRLLLNMLSGNSMSKNARLTYTPTAENGRTPLLNATLGRRTAVAEILGLGVGIREHQPSSPAVAEVDAVLAEVLTMAPPLAEGARP